MRGGGLGAATGAALPGSVEVQSGGGASGRRGTARRSRRESSARSGEGSHGDGKARLDDVGVR